VPQLIAPKYYLGYNPSSHRLYIVFLPLSAPTIVSGMGAGVEVRGRFKGMIVPKGYPRVRVKKGLLGQE
jgi:hypothetical protein